jgi:hypothetical protein
MATVKPAVTFLGKEEKVMKFTWALTSANADGAPIPPQYADFTDRTVYFTGTWGGATAAWEGGDGTTYLACADAQGTAITRTSDSGMERVVESPEFSRPRLSTVGTNAVITATCIARKA